MTRPTRAIISILPFLAAALVGACDEVPTATVDGTLPPPQLAKPPSCPAQINLTASGLSGSLGSDGSDYTEGVGGVVAHTAAANGNLSFNVQNTNPARTVTVATSQGSAPRSTRIFTNNHEQGCGLSGMGSSSTGTAVLAVGGSPGGS